MKTLLGCVTVVWLLAGCASGFQEVTLKAVDIKFEPNIIEVQVGQPVRLTLQNDGALEHDFNIAKIDVQDAREASSGSGHGHSEADLHVFAAPGGSATLEFTPLTPGTYEFYCTVPGHQEAGAVGQLVVK